MSDEAPAPDRGSMPVPALVLGFGGLIPPVLLIGGTLLFPDQAGLLVPLAFLYAAMIFSFIGGAWWGFAARAERAPAIDWVVAVAPTLVVMALSLALFLVPPTLAPYPVAALGAAILLSPLVDRTFVRRAMAPSWWMRLRWPLSIVLGALTLALALLAGR